MGYLRCDACGAKALSAASTCPRCQHALDLLDAGGRRVALRRCSGCDLMHRVDRPCPDCGEVPVRSVRPWALGTVAAAGIAATLWVGVSLAGGSRGERSNAPSATVAEASRAVTTEAGRAETAEVVASPNGEPSAGETMSVALSAPSAEGEPEASVETPVAPDSTTWQPAVALTWVNVRSDASLDGEVVGVVSPDSRALLGATRRGWRRITLDDVTGWVDPRLFASASSGG